MAFYSWEGVGGGEYLSGKGYDCGLTPKELGVAAV